MPSVVRRVWGSCVVAPSRLAMFADPTVGAADDEDGFSGGEGGDWVWYPGAGSLRPRPLTGWWRFSGPGAGAVGTLSRTDGRARFVPTRFWATRGVADWERSVVSEHPDGRWLTLTCVDGTAVLRRRGRSAEVRADASPAASTARAASPDQPS